MNATETRLYFDRIQFTGTPSTNIETLQALQRQHLLTVPFENLDIHWHFPIDLHTEKLFDKIVNRKRGGFCYELNGLFNELLKSISFSTTLVSARVYSSPGKYSPEFDHLALLIETGGERYVADVGFGEFSRIPLLFKTGMAQYDGKCYYSIERYNDQYFSIKKQQDDGSLIDEYIFSEIPRQLEDFSSMCQYHQTSPDSHFMKGMLCSLATENGRITLSNKFLKITSGQQLTETSIPDNDTFEKALKHYFGIEKELR